MSPTEVVLRVEGEFEVNIQCRIKSVIAGEFHLISSRRIPPSTKAEMQLSLGPKVEGEVTACATIDDDTHVLSFLFRAAERRSEHRFPVDVPGRMIALSSSAPEMEVSIVDISRSGMGLRIARPVPPGAAIALQTAKCLVYGSIRHCRQAAEGSEAGIQIAEAFIEGMGAQMGGSNLADKVSSLLTRLVRNRHT